MRNHLARYHKTEENFRVSCHAPGCNKIYTDFEGYKTHLRRKHSEIMNKVIADESSVTQGTLEQDPSEFASTTCTLPDETDLSDADETLSHDISDQQQPKQYDVSNEDNARRLNASYLFETKEVHQLTQRTVDTIVRGTTSIVQNSIELLKRKLSVRMDTAGIDFRAVPGLQEFFEELNDKDSIICNPFLGMETKTQQENTFRDIFGLVVSNSLIVCIVSHHFKRSWHGDTVSC